MNIDKPLDLNSETIKELTQSCSVTPTSKEFYKVIFEQIPMGYPKDSKPFIFDADAFDKIRPNIYYLFGQLKLIHDKKHNLPIKEILKKYDDTIWTKDKIAPLLLLHLGIGAGIILPPNAQTKSCVLRTDILPTISPNDPNFEKWYNENKEKILSLRKKGGQEPSDD